MDNNNSNKSCQEKCQHTLALTAALIAPSISAGFLVVGLLYLSNNLAYCLNLRNKVILDVMSIAAGFVLRIFGGCLAVAVMPSNWMLICGFSLALLLGFGKRRCELSRLSVTADEVNQTTRKSLNNYPVEFLNILIGVSSMMCLMSYMLYTTAPEVIQLHGSANLLWTTPFVMYGVFRYSIRCIQGRGDGPVEVLTGDRSMMLNGIIWAVCVGAVVMWK